MASGFRARRDIPGWLGEARDSNGDPGSVMAHEILTAQARATTDLALLVEPPPPEAMVVVTLTEQQIRNGLLSPFSLGPLQFTWSVPNGTSTWGDYAAGEQPFGAGYSTLSGEQAGTFGTAIAAWDRLILPNFTTVAETAGTRGEIRVAFTDIGMDPGTAGYAFQGSNQVPTSKVGDIWLNNSTVGQSFFPGTDDYITLLHEIGHTLGLKHPFEPTVIPSPFEDQRFTVMSYTTATPTFSRGFAATGGGGITTTSSRVIVTTPMVLDIAAVQYLYGADPTTETGANTYNFTQGETTITAIYDAGGTDTIDVSGFTRNNVIDLTPGGYSSIGLWTIAEQIAFWQAQFPGFNAFINTQMTNAAYYEWRDNFGISLTTIIENAIGGSGNDTITGNAVANTLNGGAGNDILNGAGGDDLLIAGSGDDVLNGGEGNDGFSFGANFTSADQVNGGAGTNDQIGLQGNYTGGNALTLSAGMIAGVEVIALLAGFGYTISTVDAALAPGTLLTIHATALQPGNDFTFNGAAETDGGRFILYGGLGNDNFTGGSGDDGFYFGQDRFTSADTVNGGAGTNDQLGLDGNYGSAGTPFELSGGNISGIEVIALLQATGAPVKTYFISTNNSLVAAGQNMTIWGVPVQTGITFDGSAETDGRFTFFGGAGADRFTGGNGGDSMTGGAGADIFAYTTAAQSTGPNFDRLIGFDDSADRIDLPGAVAGFAGPASGTLSLASFDANLAAGVNAALGANQAIVFTANAGDLAGRIFGVVDANGDGDYTAGTDYVFEFVTPVTPIDQIGLFI